MARQRTAGGLVVVDVDPLQLEVGVAVVGTGGVNAVFVGDDLRVAGWREGQGGEATDKKCKLSFFGREGK